MATKIDMVGVRSGKLVVLEKAVGHGLKTKQVVWKCRCDCGNERNFPGNGLRRGTTTHCGCLKFDDLTGKRFGSLLVQYALPERNKGAVRYSCLCDCGQIKTTIAGSLLNGGTTSCGCKRGKSRIKDLLGMRFGMLRVMAMAPKRNNWHGVRWLCQCDCGNTKVIDGHSLTKSNGVTACGCRSRLAVRGGFGRAFATYKASAKSRGFAFELTEEAFLRLTQSCCAYCGAQPSRVTDTGATGGKAAFVWNGLDRIDSALGYVEGNVAPCCQMCNRAKSDCSVAQFREWVSRAFTYLYRQEQGGN